MSSSERVAGMVLCAPPACASSSSSLRCVRPATATWEAAAMEAGGANGGGPATDRPTTGEDRDATDLAWPEEMNAGGLSPLLGVALRGRGGSLGRTTRSRSCRLRRIEPRRGGRFRAPVGWCGRGTPPRGGGRRRALGLRLGGLVGMGGSQKWESRAFPSAVVVGKRGGGSTFFPVTSASVNDDESRSCRSSAPISVTPVGARRFYRASDGLDSAAHCSSIERAKGSRLPTSLSLIANERDCK